MLEAKRILIFDVNWLGDVVMSVPFIRAVRENLPNAFIAVALPKRCQEVIAGCPYIDEIIYFDERVTHRGLWKKIQFVRLLHRYRFDTAFLIHGSATRAFLCYLAGIKNRIGYETKKRGGLLTHKVTPLDKHKMHRVNHYLGILEGVGLKIESRKYDFFINDSQRHSAEEKLLRSGLKRNQPFAVFHPGANEAIRRWPVESFIEVMQYCIDTYSLQPVISGSEADIPFGRKIEESAKFKIINLCGQTSLKELGAVLEKAEFCVCGDTGPMHIASAVGTFVIALFGTASPLITSPQGKGRFVILQKDVGCSIPCSRLNCSDNRCMKAITSADVIVQIRDFMGSKPKEQLK
ncbi:MAG: lipopolysaccharide heptosyltransferase II [Deltaproteobacteria bacterium]